MSPPEKVTVSVGPIVALAIVCLTVLGVISLITGNSIIDFGSC